MGKQFDIGTIEKIWTVICGFNQLFINDYFFNRILTAEVD